MKFWLNAHLSPKFASWFTKTFGLEGIALRDLGFRDSKDHEIFQRAKEENAIIITKDSDFVEMVLRLSTPPQIPLLTTGNTSNKRLKEVFSTHLPKILTLLKNGEAIVELGSSEGKE